MTVTTLSFRLAGVPHVRQFSPMSVSLKELGSQLSAQEREGFLQAIRSGTHLILTDEQGCTIPSQIGPGGNEGEEMLSWMVDYMEADVNPTYALTCRAGDSGTVDSSDQRHDSRIDDINFPHVTLIQQPDCVDFTVGGEAAMSYVYGSDLAKPYIGPVYGPRGTSYTRLDFGTKEHPHHRSVWVAIGDVNGIDFWNEPAGEFGRQKHLSFTRLASGPVFAELGARLLWTSYDGQPLLDEYRNIKVYNTPSTHRLMDIEIILQANYETVQIGATKEAGPLGIRLTESMKVDEGGTMTNSYGAIGEAQCWGKPAYWCDYYGQSQGQTLGIAVFDHPSNEHYPTCWHIRNYGLMAPNNFHFRGDRIIERGESMTFRYRLLFHEGDSTRADVASRFSDYVGMIQAELA